MTTAIPELLSPAASMEAALAALDHGADAVYAGGGRHTLRAQSAGLDAAEVRDLCACAHERARRVYLALNTMPTSAQLTDIERYIGELSDAGALPDAFIVSDPGVLTVCRRLLPSVPLHLSTQTGACNNESLRFWAQQGVTRVVLPREMTVEEIAQLSAAGVCQTEVFVHGAMCVAVSGRCLLSAYLDGRHANRGDCAQPCRLRYRLTPVLPDGTARDRTVEMAEDGHGAYIMNSRDLCALPVLPALCRAGVSAVKIEGRTKSAHYVAAATGVYRQALDLYRNCPERYEVRPEWIEELNRHEHREYTTGFYGREQELQSVHTGKQPATVRLVGVVKAVRSDGSAVVDVRNTFASGAALIRLGIPGQTGNAEIRVEALSDMDGAPIERATANRVVLVRSGSALRVGDMLRSRDVGNRT